MYLKKLDGEVSSINTEIVKVNDIFYFQRVQKKNSKCIQNGAKYIF